ncbi:MAG: hypothetical protein H7A37_03360 [Chlamydiales bacterium]|nr:hypothetical protein [Chlamydiales bacterium]
MSACDCLSITLVIAFKKSSTVLDAVLYAWSGLGCTFGPLILMGLYYKKANKFGFNLHRYRIGVVSLPGMAACQPDHNVLSHPFDDPRFYAEHVEHLYFFQLNTTACRIKKNRC